MTTTEQSTPPRSFSHMYIIAPQPPPENKNGRATQGDEERQPFAVFSLAQINAESFDAWLSAHLDQAQLSEADRASILESADRKHWETKDKWQALFAAISYRVPLTIYGTPEAASRALQARQPESEVNNA